MKTFIIINGKEVRTVKAETMEDARTKAINTCDHSKEIIVREIEGNTEINKFPNSFEDWYETFFEISEVLFNQQASEDETTLANRTMSQQGTGGLYLLAERLTHKFETEYKGTLWGSTEELCFFEKIEEFMSQQKFVETEQGTNAEKFLKNLINE